MMDNDHERQAQQLLEARDAGRRVRINEVLPQGFLLKDAYATGHILHRKLLERGYRAVGRKIGFTNQAMWEQFGLDQPIWSYVYDRTLLNADDVMDLEVAGMSSPRLEPEVVMKLEAAPDAGMNLQELAGCIAWVALGFEIVDTRFEGPLTPAAAVADFGVHARLLLGTPLCLEAGQRQALPLQLATLQVSLMRDGKLEAVGTGSNVLGSPLHSLQQLVRILASQPGAAPIAAGEIVTTGTLTPAYPIASGEEWRVAVDGEWRPEGVRLVCR